MRKYLLPIREKYYKAAMHIHTTVSDGKATPEEAKDAYKSRGYSIVAYTDHNVMVPHNELADEDFLPITAVELAYNADERQNFGFCAARTVHLNLFSDKKDASVVPGFCEKDVIFASSKSYVTDEMRKNQDESTSYSTEYVNLVIKRANEEGFLVTLNHPVWSLQNYADYIGYEGLFGVEVYNSSCVKMGFNDTEQPLFDLLKKGERVHPLVGDDWHGGDSCGKSAVFIGAEHLEYGAVFDALRRGDFYSSTGPEIYGLSIEGGVLSVDCSDAEAIILSTDRRRVRTVYATDENPIRHAEIDIGDLIAESKTLEEKHEACGKKHKTYIRLTVKDKNGNCAYTRAYFLNELI
jgi:hypothetical protein